MEFVKLQLVQRYNIKYIVLSNAGFIQLLNFKPMTTNGP